MRPPGIVRLAGQVLSHPANEGRQVRQLGRAVYFQFRGRLLRKPTLVRLGERSRMLVSVDSAAGVKAAYANPPDVVEWRVWRRFLRPGDLFIDVGANIGTYSVLAAELGAEVIAVEPNADNAERVRANLALNGYAGELREVVLTDTVKTVHFRNDQDSENHITADGGDNTTTLQGQPFDDITGGRHVRGAKIDVEGAEHQVLLGARESLAAGRIDLLQLEWNDCSRRYYQEGREPVAALLAAHGYQLYRPDADGWLRPTDATEGSDLFAARPAVAAQLMKG
jgi:FkbM family methyltransferase